ncbi:MAG TPA: A/G-specific adenine glycosylase [Pseudacidobacterium sp.]|jgi:A/G-specific adenine glycosylase|nr:A/G-specific adenine glycosylase [Pseudacidobacterium sp.]
MSGETFTIVRTDQFRLQLLSWYDIHARELPWRRTRDPYAIWISEIMLQQTRVNAVLDHYARFMARFPAIQNLANAEESDVLAIWSGLGYYRRARMMHKAAKVIQDELSGKMPETSDDLRKLPGIGDYTSAAIASIAFGESVAVVDGNVERVVTRLAGYQNPNSKMIRQAAELLLDRERPGDANQAVMELGATICLPKNPLCLQCPVQKLCHTRGEHPTAPRKEMIRKRISYAFIQREKRKDHIEVLLEQRPHDASLMAGMWELPLLSENEIGTDRLLFTVRHSITTTNYSVDIFRFASDEECLLSRSKTRKWIKIKEMTALPLTGLARKVLKRLHFFPGETAPALAAKQAAASTAINALFSVAK